MKLLFLLLSVQALLAALKPIGDSKAKVGGTFTLGFAAFPKSLNYYLANEEYTLTINQLILEPLIEMSLDSYEPTPRLARSWEVSKDKRKYTFHINPDAQFSDGHKVTADDVLFTWETIYNPKNKTVPFQGMFSSYSGVRAIDPSTIEFSVNRPHFQNLEKLSDFFVLPKHTYAQGDFNKAFNNTITGSGPYRIESVQTGDRILLTRNPNYWGKTLPQNIGRYNFEKIAIKIIPDTNVQYEVFKKGGIDYFYFLSAKMWTTQTDGEPFKKRLTLKLRGETQFPFATQGIAWNLRRALFKDKEVRLALSLLLNRERLIKEIFHDNYRISTGIVAPDSPYQPSGLKPLPYDPKRAGTILKEAGWLAGSDGVLQKEGLRFEFEMLVDNPAHQRYLTIYQEDLKRMGIVMGIRIQDWAACLKLMDEWQFDAHLIARSRSVHPHNLNDEWGSAAANVKGSGNIFGYKNPELDKLSTEADETFEVNKRKPLVQKMVLMIASDLPMTPTWEGKYFRIAYWNKFAFPGKGYHRYGTWRDAFQYWWFK